MSFMQTCQAEAECSSPSSSILIFLLLLQLRSHCGGEEDKSEPHSFDLHSPQKPPRASTELSPTNQPVSPQCPT